jgi:hypothetical protein
MRPALRAVAAGLSVLLLWAGLGLWLNGGLEDLLRADPLYMATMQRQLLWKELEAPPGGRALLFFGDSSCECFQKGDPADEAMPTLGELLRQGLAPGLAVHLLCHGGARGEGYLWLARGLAEAGRGAQEALLTVNLRSLNTRGWNAFGGAYVPGAPQDGAPPSGLERWRTGARERLRFSRWTAAGRGLLLWTRSALQQALVPRTRQEALTAAQRTPAQALEDGNARRVRLAYADGFALDQARLGALIETGRTLRSQGVRVRFYLTPMDRRSIGRYAGAGPVAQLDAGALAVRRALEGAGFEVLDLHAGLDEGFLDSFEHLAGPGRRWLAERLVTWSLEAPGVQKKKAAP